MKNSKRIVTLLLAFVMMFTTMSISIFAANFSDIADEKVGNAVNKLVANGIITGYEDGTFRPDNQITRAEFAAIVTRMKGVAGSLGTDAVTGFADLDNDSSRAWARPYVKAAVDLGIINGFEDGTFRAGEPVTYEQAVKMLVCAVGYEVVAQSEYNKIIVTNPAATWSAGYISAAGKQGITSGVITSKISEPASRGVVAVLTSNSLNVTPLIQKEDGSFVKDESAGSMLSTELIEGVVTGTYYTGIDNVYEGLGKNELNITTKDGEETYQLTEECAGEVDLEDIIGKNVTAYYDTLEGKIKNINVARNTITTIDEKDIVRPIREGEISYYNGGKKPVSVNLSDYTVIYNGKYIDPEDELEIIEDLDSNFTSGKIELIESREGRVAKITSYKVFVADGSINSSGVLSLKYDAGTYTFPSSSTERPIIYVDGKEKDYSTSLIRKYDVINLMEAPAVGGNAIKDKMYVTSTSKAYEGKITSSSDSDREVELDNTAYYLTKAYDDYDGEDKAEFKIGYSYKVYFDCTGQIAAVDNNVRASADTFVGYVLYANKKNIGIFTTDGEVVDYEYNSTVKVDGTSVDGKEVEGALESAVVNSGINDNYNKVFTKNPVSGLYQPIRYTLTTDADTQKKVVKTIDTVAAGAGGNGDNFSYDAPLKAASRPDTTSVEINGVIYEFEKDTKLMYIPKDRESTGEYSVYTPKTAFATAGDRYVEIFGSAPGETFKDAGLVLVYGSDPTLSFTAKTPYMIVTDKYESDDEVTITGYLKGKKEPSDIKINLDKFIVDEDLSEKSVDYSEIGEGDIIRYIGTASSVTRIEMIYDASAKEGLNVSGGDTLYDNRGGTTIYFKYGKVIDNSSGTNFYLTTDLTGKNELATENRCKYALEGTIVYIAGEDEIYVAAESSEVNKGDFAVVVSAYDPAGDHGKTNNAAFIYVVK